MIVMTPAGGVKNLSRCDSWNKWWHNIKRFYIPRISSHKHNGNCSRIKYQSVIYDKVLKITISSLKPTPLISELKDDDPDQWLQHCENFMLQYGDMDLKFNGFLSGYFNTFKF